MAYVSKQLPEDEQNQFGRTAPTTPTPIAQSGGSAGAGSGGAAPGVGTPTQFGSNAAKLSDYLNANKEQVANYGNQVAGNLTDKFNQTKGSIDTGYQNFNDEVGKGYAQPNQDLINQAKNNPTDFVKDQNNVKGFKSIYNDSYQGPDSFETGSSYGDINNNVNKAVQDSSLVGNSAGLQSYLNNYMGESGNTAGMQNLNTALLQRSPEASATIRNAAQPFQNLTSYLGDKTKSADQNIVQAKNKAGQISSDVQNQFIGTGGVIPSFQQDLQDRYNQYLSNSKNDFSTLKNDVSHGNLTSDEIAKLGLNPTDARSFIDSYAQLPQAEATKFNPTAYLSDKTGSLTPESFASKEDYDRGAAFNNLTGADMGWLNADNASKAGTAQPYSFDTAGASKNIADILATLSQPGTPPPVTPSEPTPTDSKLQQIVGNDASKVISDPHTIENLLGPVIGAPLQIGTGISDNKGTLQDVYAPWVNPGKTVNDVKNVASKIGDTLNPFGGNDGSSNSGPNAGEMAGTVGSSFNKYLPSQYQITDSTVAKLAQSGDILSIIPPKGAIPDSVRQGMILNVFGQLPDQVMSNSNAVTPELQGDLAAAIRNNYASATPAQQTFLANYEKTNPAPKSSSRQDALDAIDKDKASGNRGSLGIGSKYSGVF